MKLEMYQRVRLKNGKTAHIIEIFNSGEAYMVDINIGGGEYSQETVYPNDIKSVVVEVEEQFIPA
ncbi:MAG: hypothetical protein FWD03_04265 [Defluviitaleaceae bacterium]|nr:hypothetical protein [Defluviitaleaceae bacterium]